MLSEIQVFQILLKPFYSFTFFSLEMKGGFLPIILSHFIVVQRGRVLENIFFPPLLPPIFQFLPAFLWEVPQECRNFSILCIQCPEQSSIFSRLYSFPQNFSFIIIIAFHAQVVKLVDTLDLGSSAARRGGSSPFLGNLREGEVMIPSLSLLQIHSPLYAFERNLKSFSSILIKSYSIQNFSICPDGGIGRHARFRFWFPQGYVGSSPILGI